MQDFLVSISLSNINGTRLIYDENPYTNKQQLGIFLPIDEANILLTERNYCYLTFYAKQLDKPTTKISHLLKPILNDENKKKAQEMGYTKMRYQGKLRPVTIRNY